VAVKFEELQVLQVSETIADAVWKQVVGWDSFAKDVVGKQFTRAVDSIGANIAEAFGRFHYGERLQFLYFARGSLFESKYWLNRARSRNLIAANQAQDYATRFADLARQLNGFAGHIRMLRNAELKQSKTLHESIAEYLPTISSDLPSDTLFSDIEVQWLESITNNYQLPTLTLLMRTP